MLYRVSSTLKEVTAEGVKWTPSHHMTQWYPISEQRFDTSAALQSACVGSSVHISAQWGFGSVRKSHTHTHRGLNNEQGGALFPVRSGVKRSNDSVRLDVALGSGPLWDRWDTLEGHVFPSPHRLVKSSPSLHSIASGPLWEKERKRERERG